MRLYMDLMLRSKILILVGLVRQRTLDVLFIFQMR